MSSFHRRLLRHNLTNLRMPSSWYPPIQPTPPFPESLVWMWDATSWATSPVGPDISWSYAGDLQVNGVNIGPNPAIFPEGLLNTTAITNILSTDSEDFSDTGKWTEAGATATKMSDNEYLLTETTASTTRHGLFNSTGKQPKNDYNGSIDVKAGTGTRRLRLVIPRTGTILGCVDFNFQTGTIVQILDGATNSSTVSADVENLGDGWFRISVSKTSFEVVYLMVMSVTGDSVPIGTDFGFEAYTADNTSGFYVRKPQLTEGPYHQPYILPGSSQVYTGGTPTGGAWFDMDTAMVEALGDVCTIATLCHLIGSDEINIGETFNILSSTDTKTTPLYYGRDATGSYIASFDGVNTAYRYLGWGREDRLALMVRTNDVGTMFEVGAMNVTDNETSFTFGTSVNFSGAFGTTADSLRHAFETDGPIYSAHAQLWDESVDESLVIAEIEKYGWL